MLNGNAMILVYFLFYKDYINPIPFQCWKSSENTVILREVTKDSSGDYSCEIIGDHPAFRRELKTQKLTVYGRSLFFIILILHDIAMYIVNQTIL